MYLADFISVVIPTYNRAYCIEKSIYSVLNQSYSNLEIIVVDDGSTDNTKKVISSIKDKRVKYIKIDKNVGPARARNEGIKRAKGEYIAFQDSDDIWHNNKLEEQYKVINNNPECQLVFCKYKVITEDNKMVPEEDFFDVAKYKYGMFEILLNENKIGTPAILVRKNMIEKVGGFNDNISTLEDWELCLRIAEQGNIEYINKVLLDVYPSRDGVNQISDTRRIKTFLHILSLYWSKYHSINLFKNLIIRIIDDLYLLSDEERNIVEKQLEKTIPEGAFLIRQIVNQVKEIIKRNKHIDSLDKHIDFLDKHIDSLDGQIKIQDSKNTINIWKNNILLSLFDYYSDKKTINQLPDRVSIYGCGEIGRALIAVCEKAGRKVVSTIDINGKKYNSIPNISDFSEINRDIPIIITLPDQDKEIYKELKKYCNADILNIEELFQS